MKKLILGLLLITAILFLSACGNRQVGIDTNQTFNSAYIYLGGSWKLINVKNWRDYDDDEVQITSTDGWVYLTQYCNVVLMNK